jgi:hypothetical protein
MGPATRVFGPLKWDDVSFVYRDASGNIVTYEDCQPLTVRLGAEERRAQVSAIRRASDGSTDRHRMETRYVVVFKVGEHLERSAMHLPIDFPGLLVEEAS